MTNTQPDSATQSEAAVGMAEFLETRPPGSTARVRSLVIQRAHFLLVSPQIQLHCQSEHCGGVRFFSAYNHENAFPHKVIETFLHYSCNNCKRSSKTYAVRAVREDAAGEGTVTKIGETPAFGPPTPSRLIGLIGPDRDAFLKGRQAENLGLGVGAFAYYRRVVENQRSRILDEIIRVAERTGTDVATLELLRKAKEETQFSKAVEMVKDALPPVLLIDGHNPLRLLHAALSEGIHELSDDECLQLAASIRVVLGELAERSAVALKDHAELKSALSRLMRG